MKAYVADFNNILLELKSRVNLAHTPREADVIILWQDVRDSLKSLAELNRDYLHKPLIVVQHGRGATRDYLPPNKFPLLADRICVWGEKERIRMEQAGYGKNTVVTGSPLINAVKRVKRIHHDDRFIVFCPIIATHEEPFNLEVFYELKKIEYSFVQERLRNYKRQLEDGWHAFNIDPTCATENQIPYDILRKDFFLVTKCTDLHDFALYHGPVIKTMVYNKMHIINSLKVLSQADCVIGLEEGTYQLMATALGIPTVMVDGFKYGEYGGTKNYDTVEPIRSKASAFCKLPNLRDTIERELKEPDRRHNYRLDVIREEFGDMNSDPVANIIKVANELCGGDITNHEIKKEEEPICLQSSQ